MARGFTVIELVIVIVIISIVSAVSYIKLTETDDLKIHSASRMLASDIRYAQSLAIARRAKAGVIFDVGGNSYSTFLGTTGNTVADPLDTRRLLTKDFDTDATLEGVQLSSASFGDTPVVAFDPMGTPLDSNFAALSSEGIAVVSYQGTNDTVRVRVNTGRVEVGY